MKKLFSPYNLFFLGTSLLLFFYITAPSLNPLDPRMFNFHDETQLGRVSQFVLNIKSGKIPPRLAPDLSFHLGLPIFNFYAPFSYWITATFNLIGIPIISALKSSFFLAFFFSLIAMVFFLNLFFDFLPSLVGATLYITSTYFATEIVIRGNLAESWYLALLPLSLALLIKNSRSSSKIIFFLTSIILSFLFTVHNIFSIASILFALIFVLLLPQKKTNLIALVIALLISGYFLIPMVFESGLMNIAGYIKGYNYQDHFLCVWQLWRSNGWNFGASLPGCDNDLMSFKLGKIQVVLGVLGLVLFMLRLYKSPKHDQNRFLYGFIFIITVGSLFMTLYQSRIIWDIFSPLLSLLQFPWRFLLLGMFGLAFFGAYLFQFIRIPFKTLLITIIIIVSFMSARKYLIKPLYTPDIYSAQYNSEKYLAEKLAYMIPEYLTPQTDYQYWRSFDVNIPKHQNINFDYRQPIESRTSFKVISNQPFEKRLILSKPATIAVNIQYFPYWRIFVNHQEVVPVSFDKLSRPLLKITQPAEIKITYKQTKIEQLGNLISLIGILLLIFI